MYRPDPTMTKRIDLLFLFSMFLPGLIKYYERGGSMKLSSHFRNKRGVSTIVAVLMVCLVIIVGVIGALLMGGSIGHRVVNACIFMAAAAMPVALIASFINSKKK